MKIAIVGANGQVGKEIATILTKWGHEVTAIVRNPFGAAYFHLRSIKYIICDITLDGVADETIAHADAVVIAAVARGPYKSAAKANARIIQATTDKTRHHGCVYFFSSIRIFSRQIDCSRGRLDPLTAYDKEKIHSEKFFRGECRKRGIRGRIFRLGHVIGYHQAKTEKFREATQQRKSFLVDGSAYSNTVHTFTICDAILKTIESPDAFITATLVNQPQWSWETLFRQIDQSSTIEFIRSSPAKSKSCLSSLIACMLKLLRPFKKWIKDYQHLMGDKASAVVYLEKSRSRIVNEIGLLNPEPYTLSEFAYKAAPGPFLRNLTNTLQLIDEFNHHEHVDMGTGDFDH